MKNEEMQGMGSVKYDMSKQFIIYNMDKNTCKSKGEQVH